MKHPRLVDARKTYFAADPWVIALALERGADVVTDERPSTRAHRPNIPDVCADAEFGRPCFSMLEVIRREKWVYKEGLEKGLTSRCGDRLETFTSDLRRLESNAMKSEVAVHRSKLPTYN